MLVDVPKDVQIAKGAFAYPDVGRTARLPAERARQRAPGDARRRALIRAAERPLILAGRGVNLAGASAELRALAERADIPVVTTLLGLGSFPGSHPLFSSAWSACTAAPTPTAPSQAAT